MPSRAMFPITLLLALPAMAQDPPTEGLYAKRFLSREAKLAEDCDEENLEEIPVDWAPEVPKSGLYAKRFGTYEEKFAGECAEPEQDKPSLNEKALLAAHLYLAAQQRGDGSWASTARNEMAPLRDIGVTALACIALMEGGHTPAEGAFKQSVRAGLTWLASQQGESGLIGDRVGHAYLYDHAIATLALAQGHGHDAEAGYENALSRAVHLSLRARNPYGAWRYDLPPVGDNDTSVTGWMVASLKAAQEAGVAVDPEAFIGALAWIDEVSDPANGRVGYDSMGSRSSRIPGVNDQFPTEKGEGMTAVGLHLRLLLGQSRRAPMVEKHAELLLKWLPEWDPEDFGTDMYYWYFGTHAMHAMGGRSWKAWRAALKLTLEEGQRADGSWDPVGPWGSIGGRVYSTALMANCLAIEGKQRSFESKVAGAETLRVTIEAPPVEEVEEEEVLEEPILRDMEISEHEVDEPFEFSSPIDARDAARSKAAVTRGLDWLVANQSPGGSWDIDDFPSKAGANDVGAPIHDVGVTGLALLALQGDGHRLTNGDHKDAVTAAAKWLFSQQDVETGLIGDQVGHSFLYDHAIATAALAEAYRTSKSPILKATAQRAVNFIVRARNPYGAWRYDVPPVGDNDTSVTTWMVIALRIAEDAGLKIDREAYAGAINWVHEVTDPKTGRVGYDSVGSTSSRVVGVNDIFPANRGEAMTGAGIYLRLLLEDNVPDEQLDASTKLFFQQLPEWAPGEFACDMYYWMHASNAMHLVGGIKRAKWSHALRQALIPNQRADGELAGSWDPVDPWSYAGGRVYATALAILALENDYVDALGTRESDD